MFALTRDGGDDVDVIQSDVTVVPQTATSGDVPGPSDEPDATPDDDSVPGSGDVSGGDTAPAADDSIDDSIDDTNDDSNDDGAAEPTESDDAGDAATTVPDLPVETSGLTEIPLLLAWTSFSAEPLDDAAQAAEIEERIAQRSVEAVADAGTVSTICAGIPVDVAMDVTVTWQYAGQTVQSSPFSATPPGVGSCISNEGLPLEPGSYQVLPSNADESVVGYATTFVVGASSLEQFFVNNGDEAVCNIAIAPLDTAYYELYSPLNGSLEPGERIAFDVADVEQEVRIGLCNGSIIDSFVFQPSSTNEQNLVR